MIMFMFMIAIGTMNMAVLMVTMGLCTRRFQPKRYDPYNYKSKKDDTSSQDPEMKLGMQND
jgi:hypothetical protein